MADDRTDLMAREIDEELRRERLLKLWDAYGTYVIAAAVLLVVGVAGWKYYENRRAQANQVTSTQYIIALRDFALNRPYEAQKALEELLPKARSGYATLARLRLAAYDGAQGNVLEAVSTYDQIAKDGSVDPMLRDFARLQIAMLKFDSLSFTELRNQLSPLATERSPWRYSARELLGLGAAKADRPAEARNYFQRLLDDTTTPPGIAERAKVMMTVLTEAERTKAPPPAVEKPGLPATLEPLEESKGENKAKAPPGSKTK
jgi:hypothetical protein